MICEEIENLNRIVSDACRTQLDGNAELKTKKTTDILKLVLDGIYTENYGLLSMVVNLNDSNYNYQISIKKNQKIRYSASPAPKIFDNSIVAIKTTTKKSTGGRPKNNSVKNKDDTNVDSFDENVIEAAEMQNIGSDVAESARNNKTDSNMGGKRKGNKNKK